MDGCSIFRFELTMEMEWKKKYVQQRQLVREIEFEIKTNGFDGQICICDRITKQ